MNLEQLYRDYSSAGDAQQIAKILLDKTHWLSCIVDFDPMTGMALPSSLTEILKRISSMTMDEYPKDRIWHLVEHSRQSVLRLIRALSEEPRRENEYMPIRSVRELDTASFVALSRRPGRNIREKLSDKPYMQAVRHYQSVDTPENRLLKAYIRRLVELLDMREESFGIEDELRAVLQRWLRSDEADSIARWENTPPNNTLISHRDYRHVWDSWRMLQSIDEDIDRDFSEIKRRLSTAREWQKNSRLYSEGKTQFADMPVLIDWDKYLIAMPLDEPLLRAKKANRFSQEMPISQAPVCIDLAMVNPAYSSGGRSGLLSDSFVWQSWNSVPGASGPAEICLFESDAFCSRDDVTTVSSADLLFSKSIDKDHLNAAACAFSERLAQRFSTESLIWLTPDSLNEFDLEIMRRNINANFPKAEPLPCSVAAVIECIDYESITGDGYSVAVIDTINSKSCMTVLIARYDEKLAQAAPETKGYIWERTIPRIIQEGVSPDNVGTKLAVASESGEWDNKYNPYGVRHKYSKNVIKPDESGQFDILLGLQSRPVNGGSRFIELQTRAGGIPLWRNHVPELMTKVFNEVTNQMEYFFFVGKNTTIEPVRGKAISIPVERLFTIPAGKSHFELFQGTNEATGIDGEALEYAAFLVSPDMPFETDVTCRLKMTYTYGVDDPYNLVFTPLDTTLEPVHVEWRSKAEIPVEDIPGPDFVPVLSWKALRKQVNPKTGKNSDFLKWGVEQGEYLILKTQPVLESASLREDWYEDKRGILHASVSNGESDISIHQYDFVDEDECTGLGIDSELYFYVNEANKGYRGICVATKQNEAENAYIARIHSSLYVPFIHTWSEGRSLSDVDCPASFSEGISPVIEQLTAVVKSKTIDKRIRNEYLFLLSCLGDEMPLDAVAELGKKTAPPKSLLLARTVGFALGSLNEYWQRGLLQWLMSIDDESSLRALAYAAWRNPSFIPGLSLDDVKVICPQLMNSLNIAQTEIANARNGKVINTNTYENAARYLELALALLRIRNSTELELRQYLQPWQKRSETLMKHVERLSADKKFCAAARKSRVQLDLPPRLEDEEDLPPLLYALKLYLTGDDRFSAIRVTGIKEE